MQASVPWYGMDVHLSLFVGCVVKAHICSIPMRSARETLVDVATTYPCWSLVGRISRRFYATSYFTRNWPVSCDKPT